MNSKRRKKLKDALRALTLARSIVEAARGEEQDSLDQVPENLSDSDRCAAMEDAIDALDEAIENIDLASENINNAC